jgi:cytochrome P450
MVLQNTWGISHDPEMFASPSVFSPDRFLESAYGSTESIEVSQAEGRKVSYAFGGGRRQCPGDIFAQNAFLTMAAKLVWAFDVVAKGELDMSIETGYHGGLVIGSEPFEVGCKLRSEKHRNLIMEEWEKLRHWFD